MGARLMTCFAISKKKIRGLRYATFKPIPFAEDFYGT